MEMKAMKMTVTMMRTSAFLVAVLQWEFPPPNLLLKGNYLKMKMESTKVQRKRRSLPLVKSLRSSHPRWTIMKVEAQVTTRELTQHRSTRLNRMMMIMEWKMSSLWSRAARNTSKIKMSNTRYLWQKLEQDWESVWSLVESLGFIIKPKVL